MGPAQPIAFGPTGSPFVLISGAAVIVGWSIIETAGAAAAVNIWANTTNSGQLIAPIKLAAAGTSTVGISTGGVLSLAGVTVEAAAGTVSGVVWVIPEDLFAAAGVDVAYTAGPATWGRPLAGVSESLR